MTTDVHALCRQRIDDALLAKRPPHEDPELRDHVQTCRLCEEYLDTSNRVIAGLDSFHFEVDPLLETRVAEALWLRVDALKRDATLQGDAPLERRRLVWAGVIALLFAGAGSLFDLRVGEMLASLLRLRPVEMRQDLLLFWVLPSLLPLMLFPLLPVLASRRERLV